MGTIYWSPLYIINNSFLPGVGAPAPSVGLRECLEMCRVSFRRCGAVYSLRTSHKVQKSNSFDTTTATFAYSTPFLQSLALPASTLPLSDSLRRAVYGGGCGLRIPP